MKKRWHYVTAVTILFSLTSIITGGASAETAVNAVKASGTEPVSVTAAPPQKAVRPLFIYRAGHSGLLQSELHERNYLKLLAKAYTPESEAAWLAAFEERKQVEERLPKAKPAAAGVALPKEAVKLWKVDKEALQPETADGKDQVIEVTPPADGQGERKMFTVRLKEAQSGLEGEGPSNLPPLVAAPAGELFKVEKSEEDAERQLKLQTEFNKAVEADDAAAIKELLPQLLEDYRNKTAQLSEAADKLEQAKLNEAGQKPAE